MRSAITTSFLDDTEQPQGKLAETQNFLDLLLYIRNTYKAIPEPWYVWAGLSLLAACVSNRVWISPEPRNPIYPNLYIILLGDSGAGKGQAISHSTKLIPPGADDVRELMGYFPGGTSDKALKDYLSNHLSEDGLSSRAWVICSELADSVGGKDEARRLVVALTNLYTGELDSIKDATRKWGLRTVPRACLNFLAGSTKAWFIESIGATSAEGGFLARTFIVPGEAPVRRTAKNFVPSDYEYVFDHLQERLYKYLEVRGEFILTQPAFQILDHWLYTRPFPEIQDLVPSFNRGEVQVYKLAMLLSLCESLDLEISADHMREAISMYVNVKTAELQVLNFLAAEPDLKKVVFLRDILKNAGKEGVSTTEISKCLADRGIHGDKAKRLLSTLETSGEAIPEIIARPDGRPGRRRVVWRWYECLMPGFQGK